jgi:two-component system response regulator AtoC
LEGLSLPKTPATRKKRIMSSPEDQYPSDERKYPDDEPGAEAPPRFDPSLDDELSRLAPSRATVLLIGGDPVLQLAVARALHQRSPRAPLPFIRFDCGGLTSEQVELGLFGGPAYADATRGAIERADAGTLYVATVDELPQLVQPRFLRFLDQDRKARVVASAVGDLLWRVEHGHFRLDLAERLTLVELVLPDAR